MSLRKVLLTREHEDIRRDRGLFEEKGFEVIELPLIRTEPLPFEPPQGHFDYVVFQSQKAVRYFLEKARPPQHAKLVAVGGKTQKLLESMGYSASAPSRESAQGLVEFFESIPPCRVLLPSAKEGRQELVEFLKSRGFDLVILPIYETTLVEYTKDRLLHAFKDSPIVVLASPSAVKSLFANLQKNGLLDSVELRHVVCIGETTARAYREHFKGVCHAPSRPIMEEVVKLALSLQ